MTIKYQYFTKTVPKDVIDRIDKAPILGLDIETNLHLNPHDKDGRIRLVQISLSKTEIYIFDLFILDNYEFLKYVFKGKLIIGQRLQFEVKWLWKYGIDLSECKWLFDTEICARILFNDQRESDWDDEDDDEVINLKKLTYSLKALCKRHLDVDLDKELQTSDWGAEILTDDQLEYAAYDVYYIWDLRDIFLPLIKEYNLVEICKIEFKHIFISASLEYNGIYLDKEEWESYIPEYEEKVKQAHIEIYKLLPGVYKQTVFYGEEEVSLNLGSPKQLLSKLQEYGIPTNSTDKKQLALFDKDQFPILKFLKDRAELQKHLSSYLKKFGKHIHPVTGRLHYDVFQLGAKTGRISAKNPAVLTIPRDDRWRKCFKGQNGNLFFDIDYSQIESRLTAVEANELKMLEVFNNDQDIYVTTAAIENGYSYEEVYAGYKNEEKFYKQLRQSAKAEVLSLGFGMGIEKYKNRLESDYGIKKSFNEAKQQRYIFLNKTYPRLSTWHKECTKNYESFKYLINRNKRRLWLVKPEYNLSINFGVQSLATDIIKDALNTIFFYLKYATGNLPLFDRNTIFQIAYVHDQGTWEGLQETLEKYKPIIEDIMQFVAEKHINYKVKIGAKGNIAPNWAESH